MNLLQLRDAYRRDMGDFANPPLWDDKTCFEFATDAVMEAVRRGHLILDSSTTAICTIDYTTNAVLALDARIIAIRAAMIVGQSVPLVPVKLAWLDQTAPGWRTQATGMPTAYITDWSSQHIRLYPAPSVAGTVTLSVAREPLLPLTTGTQIPEIPARYHPALVYWMRHRGYDVDDTESRDQAMVDKYEAKFAAEFGERKSARNERWAAEQSPGFSDALA